MTALESTAPVGASGAVSHDCPAPVPPGANRFTSGLTAALESLGCKVTSAGYHEWTCRLPGRRGRASIVLTPGWLSIGRSLRVVCKPGAAQSLLSRNARLADGARLAIEAGQGRLLIELPADVIPWENEGMLAALLATRLASLGAAPRVAAVQPAPALTRDQLGALFAEAGWPLCGAEDGPIEVPLDVPGRYLIATVAPDPCGVRLNLPLLVGEYAAAPHLCRAAVMQLLWLAASGVRWVRPGLARGHLSIDVHVPAPLAQAATFAHACAALSMAVSQFIEEATLLLDHQELARLYLSQADFKGVS